MSKINEARYGRACLLVLNTCPVTLRRIIDHHSKGFDDLEGLLNHRRNLHDLFHLSFRQCCCGHNTNYTPMRKQQWDLLYTKRYSNNPHGQNGQCPCMYTAIPGVPSDVMDVTLCCLVLRNICRGVDNADIDAISSVRNQLIHASSATLEDTAFNDLWKKVETAVLNLAKKVDVVLEVATKTAVQEMKDRIMNPGDLCSLKDLIHNQKCMDEIRQRIDRIETTQLLYKRKQGVFPQEKIEYMQHALLKINAAVAANVQVTPLLTTGKKLPVSQIYVPISISEKSPTLLPGQRSVPTEEIKSPKDMFYKDGEPVRYIFFEGEAGRGKTMFCRQLLQYWCTAKQSRENIELTEWEKGLDEFDFVFPIFLRHVKTSRTSLVDMICHDLFKNNCNCEDAIRHVVSSDKYRCLCIIDGLDEWNISQEMKEKLTNDGIPDIEGTSCCSFLFSFRPWKLLEVTHLFESCDRHIQIGKLTSDRTALLIENVLLSIYEMEKGSNSFKIKKGEIKSKLKSSILKSVVEIPLLVSISTILLFEKGHLADNLTNFYIALVQMLIKETIRKRSVKMKTLRTLKHPTLTNMNIPKTLLISRNRTFRDFTYVLKALGHMAYKDLVSVRSLVFTEEELEEQLTQSEFEFAVKVGLLSQCEAPGCFDEQNVSVNFFHKNVQEFLAAFHVVCEEKLMVVDFCKHLSNLKKILELSNVVIFISGLSATLGKILLEHILNVTDQDSIILNWRNSFDTNSGSTIQQLYGLFHACFLEMKGHVVEKETPIFYGKDISMSFFYCPYVTVSESHNLLQNALCHEIVSLNICVNSFDEGIVSKFLQRTKHLQSLRINTSPNKIIAIGSKVPFQVLNLSSTSLTTDAWRGLAMSICFSKQLQRLHMFETYCWDFTKQRRSYLRELLEQLPACSNFSSMNIDSVTLGDINGIHMFLDILPWLHNLDQLWYEGEINPSKYSNENLSEIKVFQGILKISKIRQIKLTDMNLLISPPHKPPDMLPTWTQIELLVLRDVVMDAVYWRKFVFSLEKVKCEFNVVMIKTNVDDRTVRHLRSSPNFSMSYQKKYYIVFTKVNKNPPHINCDIRSLVYEPLFSD